MVVRHIVMWDIQGERGSAPHLANVEQVRQAFEGLAGRIPGLRHLEVGTDVSGVDYACDVVLVTEFDSAEALRAYADHPAHLAVRQQLGSLRIARHQVDYPVR
ncbi:Dabb family protein [Herbaspirillum frisingense]|uniref:Dabb family protein n=1 Tax=Herbaspirillum frisingense TaxID=92645 RepID=UPI001F3A94BF|nr:Dabb family protein [Herbaspirillum frisingense]UIN20515.1 Dabb family protein [Herbaspirillum frisingense]